MVSRHQARRRAELSRVDDTPVTFAIYEVRACGSCRPDGFCRQVGHAHAFNPGTSRQSLAHRSQLRLPHFLPNLLHGGPDLIDLVLKQIANQQVSYQSLEMRKPLHKAAEAEAVIIRT